MLEDLFVRIYMCTRAHAASQANRNRRNRWQEWGNGWGQSPRGTGHTFGVCMKMPTTTTMLSKCGFHGIVQWPSRVMQLSKNHSILIPINNIYMYILFNIYVYIELLSTCGFTQQLHILRQYLCIY